MGREREEKGKGELRSSSRAEEREKKRRKERLNENSNFPRRRAGTRMPGAKYRNRRQRSFDAAPAPSLRVGLFPPSLLLRRQERERSTDSRWKLKKQEMAEA